MGNIERVSRETSAEESRWAFSQWELRERGKAKFALAEWMLFDRDGLEMASHESIADYHASKFPVGCEVVDATVGIGSDTLALARRGPVVGYEIDPDRVSIASWNLAAHRQSAKLVSGSILEAVCLECIEYMWCDPSRRAGGKRLRGIEEYSPNPIELVPKLSSLKLGGFKLSPMLRDEELSRLGGRREFVSFERECRESIVWVGSEIEPGQFAVLVPSSEALASCELEFTEPHARAFLFEADPAAIRAHCLGRFSIPGLGDSNGYLTSDEQIESPWLTGYRVVADHPADIARTREALRAEGFGTPVVKTRAKGVDVERIRKNLRGEGPEGIVAIYPVGPKLRHAVLTKLG